MLNLNSLKTSLARGIENRNRDGFRGKKMSIEILQKYVKGILKKKFDKERFFYEKSIYLGNGINITEALEISEEEIDHDLRKKLLSGQKLSEAMMAMGIFRKREISLVRLSEETGNIAGTFSSLYTSIKEEKELNGKIRTILIYPGILLLSALVFLVAAIYFIVPPLYDMLLSMNTDNVLLRVIVRLSELVPFSAACILLVLAIVLLLRAFRSRDLVFRLVLGSKKKLFVEMRFMEELYLLLKGGMDILETLDLLIAEGYEGERIRNAIKEGMSLSQAFREEGLSKILVNYLLMAEETGDYVESLKSYLVVQKVYFQDLLKKKTALIEPLAILIMGAVVFIIAFIVMIPMLDAYENI